MQTVSITNLVADLKKFPVINQIEHERYLESDLEKYLKEKGYDVKRQVKTSKRSRNDLVVNNICIEVKVFADASCMKQLDEYITLYNGLILVCWTASKTVREVFKQVDKSIKIPTALIELRRYQMLA